MGSKGKNSFLNIGPFCCLLHPPLNLLTFCKFVESLHKLWQITDYCGCVTVINIIRFCFISLSLSLSSPYFCWDKVPCTLNCKFGDIGKITPVPVASTELHWFMCWLIAPSTKVMDTEGCRRIIQDLQGLRRE